MSRQQEFPLPDRMRNLPRNREGYVVPWFVAWIDGKPDFRVIAPDKIKDALRFDQCWVCGGKRGRWATFVIGPMCAVNRVSAEPPSHWDCAAYSAQVCPFLTRPNMVRRESGLPEDYQEPAGQMITRNPGVTLVWTSRDWSFDRQYRLFDIGSPGRVMWFAHGREATRAEVEESIDSGLPILRREAEKDGVRGIDALTRQLAQARELLPA